MNRWLKFIAVLLLPAAAYVTVYLAASDRRRSIANSPRPELAWMKHEFRLSTEQYEEVKALHEAYKPACMEMCRRIDEANLRLHHLLSSTNQVTPEIRKALSDLAQVRTECQTRMLDHFYDVSRSMPPEQGRRYLDWVQRETLLPARGVPFSPSNGHHSP